jgi:hypothetical protein
MSRKRLTNETLKSVSRVASAREYARLAESILGPAATDREVLETAQRLSSMSLDQVRGINQRRSAIQKQTRRLAAVDGAEDPWGEAGPDQPDPTNNQAYTKQIMTTPDHAVLESLQKRDVHAPTASRASKLSRAARQKWGAKENDEDDETEEDEDESDVKAGEGGPIGNESHHEEMPEEFEGDDDDLEMELGEEEDEEGPDVTGEFDDELGDLLPEEEGGEEEHFDDMEGGESDMDLDEDTDDFDELMGEDEMGDEGHEIFEDESDDLGDEEEFEEGEDLEDEGEDLEEEGEELEDMSGGEGFEEAGMEAPMAASRKNRASSRRQASGKSPKGDQKGKKKVASAGTTKVSLDDILNLHDEDVAREASSPLEGDDLEALLGRKVQRAGNRVNSTVKVTGNALESHRAMFERVWDNEHDSGAAPQRRQASRRKQTSKPQRKIARSSQDFTEDEQSFTRTQFSPDRRRVASRKDVNEFDQVFKVPDVSRFFD